MKKKFSKLLSVLLAVSILAGIAPLSGFSFSAKAEDENRCGENLTYTLNSQTGVLRIEGTGDMFDYIYDSRKTSETRSPFTFDYNIKSIVFGDGVTGIGTDAFFGCERLNEIIIPENISKIGKGAFSRCTNVYRITVSKANPVFDSRNDCNAIIETDTNTIISGCKNTVMPDETVGIGDYAFMSCSYPGTDFPSGLKSIGYRAFYGNSNENFTKISIPDSVEYIGDYAFQFCNTITEIDLPESLTVLNEGVLDSCEALSEVTFNSDITQIGNRAFMSCMNLNNIILPDSLKHIGDYGFSNCEKLTEINLPEGLEYIGDFAFSSCNNITEVVVPDTVTHIGIGAFASCSILESVKLSESIDEIPGELFGSCTALKSAPIPKNAKSIGYGAFGRCTSLPSEITIESNIISVEDFAFSECSNITSVTFEEGVESVSEHAFDGCENISEIHIPKSLKSFSKSFIEETYNGNYDTYRIYYGGDIDEWMSVYDGDVQFPLYLNNNQPLPYCYRIYDNEITIFFHYSGRSDIRIEDLVLPDNISGYPVKNVDLDWIFEYVSLKSLTIPASVEKINPIGASCSKSIEKIIVDANNPNYDSRYDCNAIIETKSNTLIYGCKNTVIPEDVTALESKSLEGALVGTEYLYVPSRITNIGQSAFANNTDLKTVSIASGYTYLTSFMFAGCDSLDSVYIPETVKQIGVGCFNIRNHTISDVYYPGTREEWNEIKINDWNTALLSAAIHYNYEGTHLHNYIDSVFEPTYTEGGYTEHTCSVCGDTYRDTLTDPVSHEHIFTQVIIKPSTCTEKGSTKYTCTECQYSYTDDLPLAEHKLIHESKEATCVENGYEYDICSECNCIFNQNTLEATGHNYVDGVCTVCGKSDKWDYSVTGGKVTINGYNGNEKELEIPSVIDGYSVEAIADSAFAGNKTLSFVSVPDSVVSIGENAFKGCTSLKEVFVGSGVLAIGENAFADCTKLAVFCITSRSAKLDSAFSNNDSRLFIVVPYGSATANNASKTGITKLTYQYSLYNGNRYAIGFNGVTTLYRDLDYNFWTKLINVYPDAHYLYFFRLTFDGIYPDVIYVDDNHLVENSKYLTMKEVFISVKKNGKSITFKEMMDLLNSGDGEMIISFIDNQGQNKTVSEKTLSERIDEIVTAVFNALSKAINAIVSIFKKKK